jgi:hypothetical protein
MKKLEQIPKKEVFQVPEGYFEELPAQIRKKIDADKSPIWYGRPQFRIALAYITIILAIIFSVVHFSATELLIQEELSEISDERLINYLESADISLVDIIEEISIDEDTYLEIMKENFTFDSDKIEEEILLNLLKYSDELL